MISGRYRPHEQIGSGGMGVVWRASDELLGRLATRGAEDHRMGTRNRAEHGSPFPTADHPQHPAPAFRSLTSPASAIPTARRPAPRRTNAALHYC